MLNNEPAPFSVIDFPGMIDHHERTFLYNLAKYQYTGEGAIIDIGTFLGAAANALAEGLKANSSVELSKCIHAYEIAICDGMHLDCFASMDISSAKTLKQGDSYEFLIRDLLAKHSDVLDIHIQDIMKVNGFDDKIEIIFYDGIKHYLKDWAAFKSFAPKFIVGKTIVIQQDYFYERAIHLKIRQNMLAEYFECLGAVSSSVVYKYVKEIPEEMFVHDPLLDLSEPQIIDLLNESVGVATDSYFKYETMLSLTEYYVQTKQYELAKQELQEYENALNSSSELSSEPKNNLNRKVSYYKDLLRQT